MTNTALVNELAGLERHYAAAAKNIDHSMAGEFEHVQSVLHNLGIAGGYVVDIAAGDGVSQSSTLGLFQRPQWSGLAVEMDRQKFTKLAFLYTHFTNVRLAQTRVMPHTIAPLLASFEIPLDFDFLNLDIDSYDLDVLSQMLSSGYRPKVISMEINEKIPPPIYFSVDFSPTHSWQVDHFYGCSISAAALVVKAFGYTLESIQYNNAFFIRNDVKKDIPDLSPEQAYRLGYADKPDRRTLFPWNSDMESLQTLSPEDCVAFLSEYFRKYSGKFKLKIA
jgi:hypothetical protein